VSFPRRRESPYPGIRLVQKRFLTFTNEAQRLGKVWSWEESMSSSPLEARRAIARALFAPKLLKAMRGRQPNHAAIAQRGLIHILFQLLIDGICPLRPCMWTLENLPELPYNRCIIFKKASA
jgi:hypothetical protein